MEERSGVPEKDEMNARDDGDIIGGLSPSERILRSRLGAYSLHAKYDSKQLTEKGREAFMTRFEREVDPEGVLPQKERQRRAEHARKAYFTSLALKSVKNRRKKAARAHRRGARADEGDTEGGMA
ncbi:MAG TPA: hypothetical protein VHS28_05035 [Chloroflexota bacterium]|nr:hypothetical protein [Chloroflexota bacterium]